MAGALEEDARLTALFLWTVQSTEGVGENDKHAGDEEATAAATAKGLASGRWRYPARPPARGHAVGRTEVGGNDQMAMEEEMATDGERVHGPAATREGRADLLSRGNKWPKHRGSRRET